MYCKILFNYKPNCNRGEIISRLTADKLVRNDSAGDLIQSRVTNDKDRNILDKKDHLLPR